MYLPAAKPGDVDAGTSALLQLDELLLSSLNLDEQMSVVLDFFVPQFAGGARLLVGTDGVLPAIRSKGVVLPDADGVRRIPLLAARDHLGVIELHDPQPFLEGECSLLDAAANRCGLALRNALSYARERHTAHSFQNAALGAPLPHVPGYAFDAVYEAGRADALVGGDWHDVFALADGRCVLSIGDVMGSGLEAAVAMVNVRQTIRGVAHIHADPLLMIEAADRAVRAQHPERFVTTFVAVLDPVTHECSYASAGHPPPFLRDPDGRIQSLFAPGVPLGLATSDARSHIGYARVSPGSLLLLYTDGLTEATRDVVQGESRVRDALAQIAPDEPNVARRIYEQVLAGHSSDDVAILSVRFTGHRSARRWRFDPRWQDAAKRVRAEIEQELKMAPGADLYSFRSIFAEVCANLIQYAPGTVEFNLEQRDGAPVLHIVDRGPGFHFSARLPRDLFSQRGRGLFLIASLARDFTVEHRPGGGSHARITLH